MLRVRVCALLCGGGKKSEANIQSYTLASERAMMLACGSGLLRMMGYEEGERTWLAGSLFTEFGSSRVEVWNERNGRIMR